MGGNSISTESLSIFIGRALMPDRNGNPQRKVTMKEAYEIAQKRHKKREKEGDTLYGSNRSSNTSS